MSTVSLIGHYEPFDSNSPKAQAPRGSVAGLEEKEGLSAAEVTGEVELLIPSVLGLA